MILFWILVIISLAGAGFLTYVYLENRNLKLIVAAVLLAALVVAPLGIHIANNLSVGEKIGGWQEFINGSIVQAGTDTVPCDRDGNCTHTYACDPYQVLVQKSRRVYAGTDSKGNPQYRTEYYSEWETRYHSCPYATVEYSHWVKTLDFETNVIYIDEDVFDLNPVEWRPGEGLPNVQRGPSAQWVNYKNRLDAGEYPPNTRINEYDNYILASTETLLRERSGDIRKYQKAGLLPKHTANLPDPVYNNFDAFKFQAVGLKGIDIATWNERLSRFNAGFGMEFQGDVHIIAVNANAVSSPRKYVNALAAYWQSPDIGKWAIAKNSVIIVLGVNKDNSEIAWAEAKTGMPHGNGEMLEALRNYLPGKFNVDRVLGDTKADFSKGELTYEFDKDAVVAKYATDEFPFERACMAKCDKDDHGRGFISLEDDVKLDIGFGSYFIVYLITMVLAGAMLSGIGFFSQPLYDSPVNRARPYRSRGPLY